MKNFRNLLCVAVMLIVTANVFAQKASELVYTDVAELIKNGTVQILGKGFDNGADSLLYARLPADMQGKIRKAVIDLGRNSAGIAIRFSTNAKCIGAQWTLVNNFNMAHMPGTGIRGLDIYSYSERGEWAFVGTAQPNGKNSRNVFIRRMEGKDTDYIMYLPLYDGIKTLSIGVDSGAVIKAPINNVLLPSDQRKPIVVYGTSVTQGGCASRPGLVYTSVLGRKMNREFINLGFSGNGRMDKIMADKIATIDASAYVIDCLGNCNYNIIKDSTDYFIRKIASENPDVPVYMISNYYYPYQHADKQFRIDLTDENALWYAKYLKFRKEGLNNLRFISVNGVKMVPQEGDVKLSENPKTKHIDLSGDLKKSAAGPDNESTVDGVHLTDVGFLRLAEFLYKELKEIK